MASFRYDRTGEEASDSAAVLGHARSPVCYAYLSAAASFCNRTDLGSVASVVCSYCPGGAGAGRPRPF